MLTTTRFVAFYLTVKFFEILLNSNDNNDNDDENNRNANNSKETAPPAPAAATTVMAVPEVWLLGWALLLPWLSPCTGIFPTDSLGRGECVPVCYTQGTATRVRCQHTLLVLYVPVSYRQETATRV